MLEVHELLGRDLDPIDDVRRQFELAYTEDYFNPVNGDWISDDYYRIIDLATTSGTLSEGEAGKLDESIIRLNGKYGHIEGRLAGSSLLLAYNGVAEQVNAINSADPNRVGITSMLSASVAAEAGAR